MSENSTGSSAQSDGNKPTSSLSGRKRLFTSIACIGACLFIGLIAFVVFTFFRSAYWMPQVSALLVLAGFIVLFIGLEFSTLKRNLKITAEAFYWIVVGVILAVSSQANTSLQFLAFGLIFVPAIVIIIANQDARRINDPDK